MKKIVVVLVVNKKNLKILIKDFTTKYDKQEMNLWEICSYLNKKY